MMCNDCDYDYTTQFPDNCLETVEIILTSNGWYSFRDVQIDHYVPQIERMGFTIHDSAYKFLRSFYGIGIPFLSSWGRLFLVNDTILTQVPLHEYFIGIGVLPTYYSYTIDKHSYAVCHIKDIEKIADSTIFPIGGIFMRHTPPKLSLWKKYVVKRNNNMLTPALLQADNKPTDELFICEDGRILAIQYIYLEAYATIYRNFYHLIWNYYSHVKNGEFTHEQFVSGCSYINNGCDIIEL